MQTTQEITVFQAEARVLQTISAEPYSAYRPNLATPSRKPLQLPNGWRYPYDLYISGIRVRQAILILFVDRFGNVEAERDDTAEIPSLRQLLQERGALGETGTTAPSGNGGRPFPTDAPYPPPASDAPYPTAERLRDQLPALDETLGQYAGSDGQQIETIEPVWSKDETGWGVFWRLGMVRGLRRSVQMVGRQQPAEAAVLPQPHASRRSAARQWNLGRASFSRNTLRVRLRKLPAGETYLRSQWTVWSCMAYVGQYLTALGYNDVGPHNVATEFGSIDPGTEGAGFDVVRGVPTISFQEDGGWASDLSIILHELGHAIWHLLFTRPPRSIDAQQHANELKGIEEGFADYIAATLLFQGAPVQIGGQLAAAVAKNYHLPRIISAEPFILPANAELPQIDLHDIGHKWANLLWDLRSRAIVADPADGQRRADLAIFNAHLKPPAMADAPAQPLACYLQSLVLSGGDLLGRDGWYDLARRHAVELAADVLRSGPSTIDNGGELATTA